MKKMTYKCTNLECGHIITPIVESFFEAGCRYTKAVKDYALELGLICNVSLWNGWNYLLVSLELKLVEKLCTNLEKIISMNLYLKYENNLQEIYKSKNVEFSNVLSFDEQYVLVIVNGLIN